jgi:hypothetical protein
MTDLFEEKKKQVKYILTLVVCVTVGPVKSVTCLYSRLDSFFIVLGGVSRIADESILPILLSDDRR